MNSRHMKHNCCYNRCTINKLVYNAHINLMQLTINRCACQMMHVTIRHRVMLKRLLVLTAIQNPHIRLCKGIAIIMLKMNGQY